MVPGESLAQTSLCSFGWAWRPTKASALLTLRLVVVHRSLDHPWRGLRVCRDHP